MALIKVGKRKDHTSTKRQPSSSIHAGLLVLDETPIAHLTAFHSHMVQFNCKCITLLKQHKHSCSFKTKHFEADHMIVCLLNVATVEK